MSDLSISQGGNRWLTAVKNTLNKDHAHSQLLGGANLGAICATACVEGTRSRLARKLWEASADGTLCEALRKVQAPEFGAFPLEKLRLKTHQILLQATDDGSLSKVLTEVSKPKAEDIETVRVGTRPVLTQSVDDGSLFEALVEVRESAPRFAVSHNIDHARTSLAQLFAESAVDGRLLAALNEVQAPERQIYFEKKDIEDIHFNGFALSGQATDDGSLSPVLSEEPAAAPKCSVENIEDLRSNLAQLLSQASSNGSLFAALSEVQTSEVQTSKQVDTIGVQMSAEMFTQENIEDIRLRTLAIFTQATDDGSLLEALSKAQAQPNSCPGDTVGAQSFLPQDHSSQEEALASWCGACVLQSEACAYQVRGALRQRGSLPHELGEAKLKLRNALAAAMSDGSFHVALMAERGGAVAPTSTVEPVTACPVSPPVLPEFVLGGISECSWNSRAVPRPPAVKREAQVSRPCLSATLLRKEPQAVMEVLGTPTRSAGIFENVGPSWPAGPPGRAFRRRHHTNKGGASPVCLDVEEPAENTDGSDSSLVRGYNVLGAQFFSISDRPEHAQRTISSLAGNPKRGGSSMRSMSRGSSSPIVTTPSMALDRSVVSAIALDLRDSVKPAVEIVPCRPTLPQTPGQSLRSISLGVACLGKKKSPELLPAIKPKASGQRLPHSVAAYRAKDPLAWNLGVSRRSLDNIGVVF